MPPLSNPLQFRSAKASTRTARSMTELDKRERSIWIGLLCTLLFHILLFLIAPMFPSERFVGTHSNLEALKHRKTRDFNFELVNPPPPKAPPANPFKFVETNPDAPANEPDKTNNFSNRNQQSAQPDPAKEKDPENRPSVKGQDEIKNDSAIVSGDHAQPQQGAAASPNSTQKEAEQEQNAQTARAEQVPLEGDQKKLGEDKEGIGSNKSHSKAASTNADQLVDGARDAKGADGALIASQQHSAKQQPKPRPRLSAPRSTVLSNRITGTPNIGVLGRDARWSEYGEYMNELIEIIDVEWHHIVEESSIGPKAGTNVIVTFTLNSDGVVTVKTVEETAGTLGVSQCTTAITARQPYRKWTEQMIAVLGKEQTITFGFYYFGP